MPEPTGAAQMGGIVMLMEKALDKQFWHRVQTDPAYVPLLAFLRQQYDSSKLDVIPVLIEVSI